MQYNTINFNLKNKTFLIVYLNVNKKDALAFVTTDL